VQGKVGGELDTIDAREPIASAPALGVATPLPKPGSHVDYAALIVETRSASALAALLHQRVPWRLDDDVVVRRTGEPRELNGQR
jgi:hypothetical protein